MPPRNSGRVTSLPAVGGQNESTNSPAKPMCHANRTARYATPSSLTSDGEGSSPALDVSSAGSPGQWASAAGVTLWPTKSIVRRKAGFDSCAVTRVSTISTTDSEESDARLSIASSDGDPLGTVGARRMLWHDARTAMKEEQAENGETEAKRPSLNHAVKAVRKAMSFNLNRTRIIDLFKTGGKRGGESKADEEEEESQDRLDREARELLADFQALVAKVESEGGEEEETLADFAGLASKESAENKEQAADTASSIAAHAEKCLGLLSRLKMNALNNISVVETAVAGNAKASDHFLSVARVFGRPAMAVEEWQQQVPGQCNDAPEPRGSNLSGQNSSLLEFVKDTINGVEEASRAAGAGKGEEDANISLEEVQAAVVASRRRQPAGGRLPSKWLGAVKLARSNMEFLDDMDNDELSQREQLDQARSRGLKSLLAEGRFQEAAAAARVHGGTASAGSAAGEAADGASPGEDAVVARHRRLRAVALAVTMWNRFQLKGAGAEQEDKADGGSSASSGTPCEAASPKGARGEGTDTSETDEHMEDGAGAGAAVGARMPVPDGWRRIMSGRHDRASSDASPQKTSTTAGSSAWTTPPTLPGLETSSGSPQAPVHASVGRRTTTCPELGSQPGSTRTRSLPTAGRRLSTTEDLRAPASPHRLLPGGASANCRQPVRTLHVPPQCRSPTASSKVSARSERLDLMLTGAAFSPGRPAVCKVPVQTQPWPSFPGGSFHARRSSKTRAGRSEDSPAGEALEGRRSASRPAARLGVLAHPGELRRRASA